MRGLRKLAEGPGHLGLVEVAPPAEPGPGQLVLDVLSAGVCGTDLHIRDGEYGCLPPVTLGHEIGGVVASVGAGVDRGLLGQRVAVETFHSTCGRCRWCRGGRPNTCPWRRSLGTHVDGGFAEQVSLPAINAHVVPDHLPDAAISLLEPLACVCNALSVSPRVSAGDRVLVIGPGAIGNLAAQVARASGAAVVLSGLPRDRERLELARSLGLTAVSSVDLGGDPGDAFDVVVETSGSEGGWDLAVRAARRGGRILQMGLVGHRIAVDVDLICNNELTVSATFASHPGSWLTATRLVRDRAVELAPLVSGVLALEAWEELFAHIAAGDGVKYVFDPRVGVEAGLGRARPS